MALAQAPQQLQAPADWQRLEFISDLHLHEADEATFLLWQHYIQHCQASALLVLGDLFDAWVGDDTLATPEQAPHASGNALTFEQRCATVLQQSAQLRPTYFIHGNRDFLIGSAFFLKTGVQPLADPCVLTAFNQRYVLTHGDALCTDDAPYMQWRAMVRSHQWQSDILSQSLAKRRAFAQHIRNDKPMPTGPVLTDINRQEGTALLKRLDANCLVHGHTHQPGHSVLVHDLHREVLSDWDCQANPPRAQVLRLDKNGWHRLGVEQAIFA